MNVFVDVDDGERLTIETTGKRDRNLCGFLYYKGKIKGNKICLLKIAFWYRKYFHIQSVNPTSSGFDLDSEIVRSLTIWWLALAYKSLAIIFKRVFFVAFAFYLILYEFGLYRILKFMYKHRYTLYIYLYQNHILTNAIHANQTYQKKKRSKKRKLFQIGKMLQ